MLIAIINQLLVEEIDKKVKLTTEEIESLTAGKKNSQISFEDIPGIDVEFTESELTLLKKSVEKLDKTGDGEVTRDMVHICAKIQNYVQLIDEENKDG